MTDFISVLRRVIQNPDREFSAKESLEVEEAFNKWKKQREFVSTLREMFYSLGYPRNVGETSAIAPKAPSSPESKPITEELNAQKEAAAEYYRGKGYDVTAKDVVRHPGGGLSLKGFGKESKRLPLEITPISLPQISETYKGGR